MERHNTAFFSENNLFAIKVPNYLLVVMRHLSVFSLTNYSHNIFQYGIPAQNSSASTALLQIVSHVTMAPACSYMLVFQMYFPSSLGILTINHPILKCVFNITQMLKQ